MISTVVDATGLGIYYLLAGLIFGILIGDYSYNGRKLLVDREWYISLLV
ncbi:MAG: hypothetical protein IPL28_24165 [Chloroflexi bacterium]|nr:hypothetical protein [Chloroflexota bacterium]